MAKESQECLPDNFIDIIIEQLQKKPLDLFKFLNGHPILEAGWVGNDPKACRMFVNWVDNGAFYLFEDGFCTDIKPQCHDCPIGRICKKYTKWTAYQVWNG